LALSLVTTKAAGTPAAAQAQLLLGHVHALRHAYPPAQAAYETVIRSHSQESRAVLSAMTALAALEEAQSHWSQAIARYQAIADRFPWSQAGLQAPIRIAQLSEPGQSAEEAQASWERVLGLYRRLLSTAPAQDLKAPILGLLSVVYQRLEKWPDAAQVLEEMAQDSGQGINRPKILYDLAMLYASRLEQPARAQTLYSELAQKYPNDPFGRAARARLWP
jgi:TolA-binding protein